MRRKVIWIAPVEGEPTSVRWRSATDCRPIIFSGGGGSSLNNGTGSSFSLETENLRGKMFKLATLLVTYGCNVIKKLRSVG